MSISYEVYLQASRLPDTAGVEAAVRVVEPGFAFAEPYDLAADSGWCPCRVGRTECGFEWELDIAEDVPPELASRGFDRVAQLNVRSSSEDAVCAVLVALGVAERSGGVVVTPDGERVEPGDARGWASALVRALRKSAPRRRRGKAPPPSAEETVRAWLDGLADATVRGVVRSLPGDPLLAIRFTTGLALKTRRWTVATPGEGERSTAALPRDPSREESQALETAFRQLEAVLRSGPAAGAGLDLALLTLRLAFPGGELQAHPQAAAYRGPHELAFRSGDRWELEADRVEVFPEMDDAALVRRSW